MDQLKVPTGEQMQRIIQLNVSKVGLRSLSLLLDSKQGIE